MARLIGTISRGLRAPIVKEGDDLKQIVVDTVMNLPKIPGGKKLVYTNIDLPLTAIADFEKLGETDELFKNLAEICKRHNMLWNAEAEKYLLANAKAI
jgi:hypothetical protein